MPDDGSGGLGAASVPLYAPYIALVGFIAGAVWQSRRILATRQ
jgi:hypothetical protein